MSHSKIAQESLQGSLTDKIFDKVSLKKSIHCSEIRRLEMDMQGTERMIEFLKKSGYTLNLEADIYEHRETI